MYIVQICFFIGGTWGWALKDEGGTKPYICEIGVGELYKIVGEERGFGKKYKK